MYFWMYTCRYNYYIHIIHTLLLEAAARSPKKKTLEQNSAILDLHFLGPPYHQGLSHIGQWSVSLDIQVAQALRPVQFHDLPRWVRAQATVRNISANVMFFFKGVKVCQGLCLCVMIHAFLVVSFGGMLVYSDCGAQSSWLDKTHQLFILKTLQQTPHFLLIPARSFWYRDPLAAILSPWLGPRTWARRLADRWICQAWLNWVLTDFLELGIKFKKGLLQLNLYFSGSLRLSLLDRRFQILMLS